MPEVTPYEDEVLQRLHEVAAAARQVPAEHQPKRLQDALASLVAIDVVSTGTVCLDPFADQAGMDVSS
jgi:hypothetical protein